MPDYTSRRGEPSEGRRKKNMHHLRINSVSIKSCCRWIVCEVEPFAKFWATEETSHHSVIAKKASLSFARSSIPDEMRESSRSRDASRQRQRWKCERHG